MARVWRSRQGRRARFGRSVPGIAFGTPEAREKRIGFIGTTPIARRQIRLLLTKRAAPACYLPNLKQELIDAEE